MSEVFVSDTCMGETCWCGQPAVRKVGEEFAPDEPNPIRHNLTRYICAEHYAQLMGPAGARQVGITPVVPAREGEVVCTTCKGVRPEFCSDAFHIVSLIPEGKAWTEDAELERRQADYERGFQDGLAAAPIVPAPEGEAWRYVSQEEVAQAAKFASTNLATPVVPVGVSREEIARIIDPVSWKVLDVYGQDKAAFIGLTTDHSLSKADAIIAALRPTDT